MDGIGGYQIIWALLLGFMIWRMIPVAKHWMANGPKGSGQEWMTTALLLAGVAAFIVFLVSVVRG